MTFPGTNWIEKGGRKDDDRRKQRENVARFVERIRLSTGPRGTHSLNVEVDDFTVAGHVVVIPLRRLVRSQDFRDSLVFSASGPGKSVASLFTRTCMYVHI